MPKLKNFWTRNKIIWTIAGVFLVAGLSVLSYFVATGQLKFFAITPPQPIKVTLGSKSYTQKNVPGLSYLGVTPTRDTTLAQGVTGWIYDYGQKDLVIPSRTLIITIGVVTFKAKTITLSADASIDASGSNGTNGTFGQTSGTGGGGNGGNGGSGGNGGGGGGKGVGKDASGTNGIGGNGAQDSGADPTIGDPQEKGGLGGTLGINRPQNLPNNSLGAVNGYFVGEGGRGGDGGRGLFDSSNPNYISAGGGGGGGAGGSGVILIAQNTITVNGSISANGGKGGRGACAMTNPTGSIPVICSTLIDKDRQVHGGDGSGGGGGWIEIKTTGYQAKISVGSSAKFSAKGGDASRHDYGWQRISGGYPGNGGVVKINAYFYLTADPTTFSDVRQGQPYDMPPDERLIGGTPGSATVVIDRSALPPTQTPTFTKTFTSTNTATKTATRTPTMTKTLTFTPTVTLTSTVTNTPSLTSTFTATATATATPTLTFTPTNTLTLTPSLTSTPSATRTATATVTQTPFLQVASISSDQKDLITGGFQVVLKLNTGTKTLSAAKIVLNYTNPAKIKNVTVTIDPAWSVVPLKTVDLVAGHIELSAGYPGGVTGDSVILALLNFQVKPGEKGQTEISYDYAKSQLAIPDGTNVIKSSDVKQAYTLKIKADLNNDNRIDELDLSVLAEHWGNAQANTPGNYNLDTKVDELDLSVLAENWYP